MSSWFNTKPIIFTSSVALQVNDRHLYGGIKINSNYGNVYFVTVRHLLILPRPLCVIDLPHITLFEIFSVIDNAKTGRKCERKCFHGIHHLDTHGECCSENSIID